MAGETSVQPVPELYFYLSHAAASLPDHWMRTFYEHLAREVKRLARTTLEIGFADLQLTGEERDAAAALAVNTARVFVPLYSPEFLAQPSREEATFRARLQAAGA